MTLIFTAFVQVVQDVYLFDCHADIVRAWIRSYTKGIKVPWWCSDCANEMDFKQVWLRSVEGSQQRKDLLPHFTESLRNSRQCPVINQNELSRIWTAAKSPLVGIDLPSPIHVHIDEHRISDQGDFFLV